MNFDHETEAGLSCASVLLALAASLFIVAATLAPLLLDWSMEYFG